MNRIRELGLKAGVIVEEYNGFDRTDFTRGQYDFYKSIVQDCIDTLMNDTDRYRKEYFAGLLRKKFDL